MTTVELSAHEDTAAVAGPSGRTVIAAVDNSAAARPVVATAAALAPLLGADVRAVQVTGAPGAGGCTAQAAAEAFGLACSTIVGDPLTELGILAGAEDVVAVVVGARSRPGGRRPAGHLALGLADATDKPVVIVPPTASPPDRMRSVLLAIEGKPGRARALRRAVELALAIDLELVVVHVDDELSIPSFSDQVQHETDAYTQEFLARYCRGAPRARLELRIGVPADEIIAAAEAIMPDMIAVGWPHEGGPTRGETAREVLDRSTVPVLLVAIT